MIYKINNNCKPASYRKQIPAYIDANPEHIYHEFSYGRIVRIAGNHSIRLDSPQDAHAFSMDWLTHVNFIDFWESL